MNQEAKIELDKIYELNVFQIGAVVNHIVSEYLFEHYGLESTEELTEGISNISFPFLFDEEMMLKITMLKIEMSDDDLDRLYR